MVIRAIRGSRIYRKDGRKAGSPIDEVAARVSLMLETTVLLCALGVDRALGERDGVREWFHGFRGEIWAMRDDGPPGVWLGGGGR